MVLEHRKYESIQNRPILRPESLRECPDIGAGSWKVGLFPTSALPHTLAVPAGGIHTGTLGTA